MKKLLMIALGIVLAMSVAAFATDTRVLTMGENYNVLLDESNVWMYTGRVFNYPNLATGEFYQDYYYDDPYGDGYRYDFGQFGINWKFGEAKPWVLGTYFTNGSPVLPGSYSGAGPNYVEWDSEGALPDNRRISLLYGRQFGTYNFGFGFDYTYSSWSDEASTDATLDYKYDENFRYMMFSLGLTPAAGNWDLAAHFGTGTWKDETSWHDDEAGADSLRVETEPDGYMDFALMGRYFKQLNPTVTLVPHATFAFGKHGTKNLAGEKYSSKMTMIDFGAGINYTPTTNVLAVLDLGFQINTVKDEFTPGPDGEVTDAYEYKWTYNHMPYWKIGMEGEVCNWMDIRLGATSWWEGYKSEYTTTGYVRTFKDNGSWNYTYLGVGLNFGKFHLDTYTDPQIILDGFNFMSGSDDAWDLNFRVSALYELM